MAAAAMKMRRMGCRIQVNNMGAKVRVEVDQREVKTHLAEEKAVAVDGDAPRRTRNQRLLKEKREQVREVDLERHEGKTSTLQIV